MRLPAHIRTALRAEFTKRQDAGEKLSYAGVKLFMAQQFPNDAAPSRSTFYNMVNDLRNHTYSAERNYKRLALRYWFNKPKNKAKAVPDSEAMMKRLAELVGANRVRDVCGCVKTAVDRGTLSLEGDNALDQIVCEDKCCMDCADDKGKPIKIVVRLRDFIFQDDYAGTQYCDHRVDSRLSDCDMDTSRGPIICPEPNCEMKYFVTGLCRGDPELDGVGKSHNHCVDCPRFGVCIGDYRKAHCDTCQTHYFTGGAGQYGCSTCDPEGWNEEDEDD